MENKVLVGILVFLLITLGASTGLFKDITGYTTIKNSQPTTTLVSPGNNGVVHTDKIIFTWNYNDIENDPQTAFILQVDKTRMMENPISKMVSSPSTSYQLTLKIPEKITYYWRVKTKDARDWGEWSRPSSFSLDLNIKECSDSTPLWQCSLDKPKWCYTVLNTPVLVNKCSKCGCLQIAAIPKNIRKYYGQYMWYWRKFIWHYCRLNNKSCQKYGYF